MKYTKDELNARSEAWEELASLKMDWRNADAKEQANQLRAHAALIEENERLREALQKSVDTITNLGIAIDAYRDYASRNALKVTPMTQEEAIAGRHANLEEAP